MSEIGFALERLRHAINHEDGTEAYKIRDLIALMISEDRQASPREPAGNVSTTGGTVYVDKWGGVPPPPIAEMETTAEERSDMAQRCVPAGAFLCPLGVDEDQVLRLLRDFARLEAERDSLRAAHKDAHEQWGLASTAHQKAQAEADALRAAAHEKEKRIVETEVRAYGWMKAAHDALAAGKPVKFPEPADVPNLRAAAQVAADALARTTATVRKYADEEYEDGADNHAASLVRGVIRPAEAALARLAEQGIKPGGER